MMPAWFWPVFAVTGTLVAISGLRILKDKGIFGEDETEETQTWEPILCEDELDCWA